MDIDDQKFTEKLYFWQHVQIRFLQEATIPCAANRRETGVKSAI